MTTWNHRIVKVTDDEGNVEFGMYEVYYDEAGHPISRTAAPAEFTGDTWMEVADAVARAHIGRPWLDDADIATCSCDHPLRGATA